MTTSSNPANKPALVGKHEDNGADTRLLQPVNQVPFTAVSAAYAQAEVTAIRDALVAAGIMRPAA